MKPLVLTLLVLTLGLILVASSVRCEQAVMAYSGDDSFSDNCSGYMQDDGRHYESVVRDEEVRSVPNQPLSIDAEHNGGIRITTWDKPDFSVKLCKQVASDSERQGRQILSATRLEVYGATVFVSSPGRNDDYSLNALLVVRAPRGAQVSMKVKNGVISVRHFTGTAEARAMNGRISLRQSDGKLTVHTQNGGVSVQDCGGEVTAEVENGSLSITLPKQWDGKGLEAHTQNGGVVIRVPRNFSSGLEVSASKHVSITCKGDACDQGQRTRDNDHRMFRLGNGSPQVHATTINGGIVIEERERSWETLQ